MSRRLLTSILWGALLCGAAVSLQAQEPSPQEVKAMDAVTKWKVINTAIFVVLLGWGIAKTAPRFFNTRSADIQKAIRDATGLKMDAELRYSEVDRRMATLPEELKRLRAEAAVEMEREHARLRQETAEERERLTRNVAAEIDAFRAEGAHRVREHTVQAALALAERKLQEGAGTADDSFFQEFLHLVERSAR